MSNIRNLKYAARDSLGGGTNLTNEFVKSRMIEIDGPDLMLEKTSIALHTDYALRMWDSANIERALKV